MVGRLDWSGEKRPVSILVLGIQIGSSRGDRTPGGFRWGGGPGGGGGVEERGGGFHLFFPLHQSRCIFRAWSTFVVKEVILQEMETEGCHYIVSIPHSFFLDNQCVIIIIHRLYIAVQNQPTFLDILCEMNGNF